MLLSNLNLLATAPGGVARLRELILTLAVQGKLLPQDPRDEPARVLLQAIRAEKDRLMGEGKIKRDKPLAAIAEEEKPFEVPVGWEWVRLADISDFTNGFAFPSSEFCDSGVGVIKIGDIQKGEVTTEKMSCVSKEYARHLDQSFVVNPGDMLIAMSGATTGKLGFNNTSCDLLLNQRVGRIKLILATQQFAYLYLATKIAENLEMSAGSAIPNLSTAQIKAIEFPLPPLPEQTRIVTRVEELMRLCDALESKGQLEAAQHAQLVSTLLATLTDSATPDALSENWQRLASHFDLLLDRPQAVDALEQTLLQLAVRGLLVPQDPAEEPARVLLQTIRAEKDRLIAAGQLKRDKPLPPVAPEEQPFALPQGWEWTRAGDVVGMLNGYAFKSEWFKASGVRLLRNVNIGHGRVDWMQPEFIDSTLAAEFEQFALREGDIVLTLDRPIISTGLKLAVLTATDLPCFLLQRVARLAPELKVISPDFLVLWLQSDLFMGTIDPGRSTGVPHISTKQVGSLVVGLPPLPEQARIAARVEALRGLCADLRQRLAASQRTQAQLAEALVSGVASPG